MAKKKVNSKEDKENKKELLEHQKMQKELKEIEEHPIYAGDGVIELSDGRTVNYKTLLRNIQRKIIEMPDEEKQDILEISSEYRRLKGQAIMLKRRLSGNGFWLKNEHWHKAQEERGQEMLDLFGKMYSAVEVHKIITVEWGLGRVKYEDVLKFSRENKDLIAELKDKYQNDVESVRLVHKRSRLDELTELYASRKLKYEETQSKGDYDLMLKTLEQIRKEVEGQQIHINGQIKVEHELAVQEHVNREIMKNLNINDIIIGRLCARLNTNPKYILYRLHTSYYSKFTGFMPNDMNDDNEVEYPSQIVYDFNRISELNNELNSRDDKYREEPDIEEAQVVELSSLKDKLKAKLAEKKKKANKVKKNIDRTEGK